MQYANVLLLLALASPSRGGTPTALPEKGSVSETHPKTAVVRPGPVPLDKSTSPKGTFLAQLTHDRASSDDYVGFEDPDFQIVRRKDGKILLSRQYFGDSSTDAAPLAGKIRVLWNEDETAVALTARARFMTELLVLRLEGTPEDPKGFREVILPDTRKVIEAMIPKFKKFRSRWHDIVEGWTARSYLRYGSGVEAQVNGPEGVTGFPGRYHFTVDISDPTMPLIRAIEIDEDD